YAYVEDFPEGGNHLSEPTQAARARQAFTVWARPTPLENGCFLLKLVHREVHRFADKGLDPSRFALAKSHLTGNAPLLATSLERRLGYAIDSAFYGIRGDYLKNLQAASQKATRAEVDKLVRGNIRPGALELVVVTPDPAKFKAEIL